MYQLQSYQANYNYLKAGIVLKASCIPAVNTLPHGGPVGSLQGNTRGSEPSGEPSMGSTVGYMQLLAFFLSFYCLCYCTTVLSHWGFYHGKFGLLSRGKPAATESRYLTYCACRMYKCFHNPPNSDIDYGIFNVRTDVNACDCTKGVHGHM